MRGKGFNHWGCSLGGQFHFCLKEEQASQTAVPVVSAIEKAYVVSLWRLVLAYRHLSCLCVLQFPVDHWCAMHVLRFVSFNFVASRFHRSIDFPCLRKLFLGVLCCAKTCFSSVGYSEMRRCVLLFSRIYDFRGWDIRKCGALRFHLLGIPQFLHRNVRNYHVSCLPFLIFLDLVLVRVRIPR